MQTAKVLRLSLEFIFLLNLAVGALSADKYSRADFPKDFIFGAATSAYQVEGAANEDGRTPSIWDTFAHAGFAHGATGDVAVDGYRKYKNDVQLMVDTGLDAYRFSISWSRLIPNGRGPVNPKGLAYYNNLINELVKNGIQPHVTLHHYDLPQALEDEYGGWVSRKIIRDFTAYADVCFREFGDRVSYWSTANEPNVFASGGYDLGFTPPARCSPPFGLRKCTKGNSSTEPYLAVHHTLLAHASVARLYRKRYQEKQHGFVGMTVYTSGLIPATDTKEDTDATERAFDFLVGWIIDPLVYGDYPGTMKTNVGSRLPAFTISESELVKGSMDFIGIIYYLNIYVKDNPDSLKLKHRDYNLDSAVLMIYDQPLTTEDEFAIAPWSLQGLLEKFKHRYDNPPIYIYENGQRTKQNASLQDVTRVNYLQAYIGGVLEAVRNGSNTRGYFTWSLMDVFELLDGFRAGFGLYYVDLDDPEFKRYPKLSQQWYSNFLKGSSKSMAGAIKVEMNSSTTAVGHFYQ